MLKRVHKLHQVTLFDSLVVVLKRSIRKTTKQRDGKRWQTNYEQLPIKLTLDIQKS